MTTLIVAATLLVIVAGLLVGAKPLGLSKLWPVLLSPDGKIDSILVWSLRLPRSRPLPQLRRPARPSLRPLTV